ncbi:group II intron maturase-specific domain-containing protein [Micromonospora marina]|uniref:group II intron maturase-specific domain-containing protein n=1 Tax=Micromonospora marina TaxID=307120 RepID=UPI003D74E528
MRRDPGVCSPTAERDQLAVQINPIVAGWMNYYGRFYPSQLYPFLKRINTYLCGRLDGRTSGCAPTSRAMHGEPGSSIEIPACSPSATVRTVTARRPGGSGR